MKIFCIGLNKTGTISLHQALTDLGFASLHWGGPASRRAVERAIREGAPLLEHLGDYDAYSDIQRLSMSFDVLDRQYPGSRFILTTRDVDEWIDSRRRHVERNRERKERGEYDGTFLDIEPERWRRQFLEHHARSRSTSTVATTCSSCGSSRATGTNASARSSGFGNHHHGSRGGTGIRRSRR